MDLPVPVLFVKWTCLYLNFVTEMDLNMVSSFEQVYKDKKWRIC